MKYPKRENATSRADDKLNHILHVAARIISLEGYERASIRKVAKASRMSLAGLYYYFSCKEELLFLIQYHTFDLLITSLKEKTKNISSPEKKLRALINNHLDHFIDNMHELRVCAHELETLSGDYYRQVLEKRKAYFREALLIVEDTLSANSRRKLDPRLATLYLFGMLNWIYMWYSSEKYQDSNVLSEQLLDLFMRGIRG